MLRRLLRVCVIATLVQVSVGAMWFGASVSPAKPNLPATIADDVTVQGCLERDAASSVPIYTLIEENGRDRRLYRLRPGPGIDLAAHLGQIVEVVGPLEAPRGGAHAEGEVTVRKLSVIKPSC